MKIADYESEMERKLRGVEEVNSVKFGKVKLTLVRDQTYI